MGATLEQVCDEYLAGLPFTLWSDFEIKNAERRKIASKWLAEQIRSVGELVVTLHGGTLDTD